MQYQIGQLSEALNVPVETIRYYEKEKLLPKPERTSGNYRVYSEEARSRLDFILNCRTLDMTLDEIRHLLKLRDKPRLGCAEVNSVIDTHIGHVRERMKALRALERQLKDVRARCDDASASKDCGIIEVLSQRQAKERRKGSAVHRGVHSR